MISLALLLAAQAAAGHHGAQAHPGHSAAHYAKTLEDPKRDQWQRPDQVVQALRLRRGEVVADIGAGTGYFSRRMATQGAHVLAVDIDPELLNRLKELSSASVETRLARPDDPGLEPASVDTIFICNVLHHIANRGDYLPKLKRSLKNGGRIVVLEFWDRPLPVGPAEQYKIPPNRLDAEMQAIGLKRNRSLGDLPYQYFFEYR